MMQKGSISLTILIATVCFCTMAILLFHASVSFHCFAKQRLLHKNQEFIIDQFRIWITDYAKEHYHMLIKEKKRRQFEANISFAQVGIDLQPEKETILIMLQIASKAAQERISYKLSFKDKSFHLSSFKKGYFDLYSK